MYYILAILALACTAAYFMRREDFGYAHTQYRPSTTQEMDYGYHTKYDEKEFTPHKTSDLFMVCDQNIGTCFNQ